jgi:hypothetical protein
VKLNEAIALSVDFILYMTGNAMPYEKWGVMLRIPVE